jgi:hypothetical protein
MPRGRPGMANDPGLPIQNLIRPVRMSLNITPPYIAHPNRDDECRAGGREWRTIPACRFRI